MPVLDFILLILAVISLIITAINIVRFFNNNHLVLKKAEAQAKRIITDLGQTKTVPTSMETPHPLCYSVYEIIVILKYIPSHLSSDEELYAMRNTIGNLCDEIKRVIQTESFLRATTKPLDLLGDLDLRIEKAGLRPRMKHKNINDDLCINSLCEKIDSSDK